MSSGPRFCSPLVNRVRGTSSLCLNSRLVPLEHLRWCTNDVQEDHTRHCPLLVHHVLPAKRHVSKVEPRGFEPLASAVQSQGPIVALVRSCSENPAKRRVYLCGAS